MVDPISNLQVQLCYAEPGRQFLRALSVAEGCTLQQAILQSGILREFTTLDLSTCQVGIYGKLQAPETVLRAQDRIEIYRPLIADPKESRRRRAAHKARSE